MVYSFSVSENRYVLDHKFANRGSGQVTSMAMSKQNGLYLLVETDGHGLDIYFGGCVNSCSVCAGNTANCSSCPSDTVL